MTSSKPSSSHQSTAKRLEDSVTDGLSNLSLTETTPTKVSMATMCEATSTPVRGSSDLSSLEPAGHGGEVEDVVRQREAVSDKVVGTPDMKSSGSVTAVATPLGVYKVTLKTSIVFEQEGHKSNWVRLLLFACVCGCFVCGCMVFVCVCV